MRTSHGVPVGQLPLLTLRSSFGWELYYNTIPADPTHHEVWKSVALGGCQYVVRSTLINGPLPPSIIRREDSGVINVTLQEMLSMWFVLSKDSTQAEH